MAALSHSSARSPLPYKLRPRACGLPSFGLRQTNLARSAPEAPRPPAKIGALRAQPDGASVDGPSFKAIDNICKPELAARAGKGWPCCAQASASCQTAGQLRLAARRAPPEGALTLSDGHARRSSGYEGRFSRNSLPGPLLLRARGAPRRAPPPPRPGALLHPHRFGFLSKPVVASRVRTNNIATTAQR